MKFDNPVKKSLVDLKATTITSGTYTSDSMPTKVSIFNYGYMPFDSFPFVDYKLFRDGQEVNELVYGAICSNQIILEPPIKHKRVLRANYCNFEAMLDVNTKVYVFDNTSLEQGNTSSLSETTIGVAVAGLPTNADKYYFILPKDVCQEINCSRYNEYFHDHSNIFKGLDESLGNILHLTLCKPIRECFNKQVYLSVEGGSLFRVNLTDLIYVEFVKSEVDRSCYTFKVTNLNWLYTHLNKQSVYYQIVSTLIRKITKLYLPT